MPRTVKKTVLRISVATVALLAASSALAWTGPTASPPNSNASVPINASATTQTKYGGLNLLGVLRIDGTGVSGGHQYELYPNSPSTGDLSIFDRTGGRNDIVLKGGGSIGLAPTAGYVGIGTDAPASLLSIYPQSDQGLLQNGIRVYRPGVSTVYGSLSELYGGANLYLTSVYPSSDKGIISLRLSDGTNNVDAVYAKTNPSNTSYAYVGINNTSPAEAVDVAGNIKVSNDIYLGAKGAWLSTLVGGSPNRFGGMFTYRNSSCARSNPYTGYCSCPSWASTSSYLDTYAVPVGGYEDIYYCLY